jgi:hypothetical protein
MTGINLNVVGDVMVFTDIKVGACEHALWTVYKRENRFQQYRDMDTSYMWQV